MTNCDETPDRFHFSGIVLCILRQEWIDVNDVSMTHIHKDIAVSSALKSMLLILGLSLTHIMFKWSLYPHVLGMYSFF